MPDGVRLVVATEGMPEKQRAEIARELRKWIKQNVPEVEVKTPEGAPQAGQKGVEIAAGTLALLFSSGVAKALIDCIATYIRERRRAVKFEVSDSTGAKVTLSADNIGRPELDRLVNWLGDQPKGAHGAPSAPASPDSPPPPPPAS